MSEDSLPAESTILTIQETPLVESALEVAGEWHDQPVPETTPVAS